MLYFKKSSFIRLEFTYPDYADEKNRVFFDKVRGVYREQVGVGGDSS